MHVIAWRALLVKACFKSNLIVIQLLSGFWIFFEMTGLVT